MTWREFRIPFLKNLVYFSALFGLMSLGNFLVNGDRKTFNMDHLIPLIAITIAASIGGLGLPVLKQLDHDGTRKLLLAGDLAFMVCFVALAAVQLHLKMDWSSGSEFLFFVFCVFVTAPLPIALYLRRNRRSQTA